jgi:hypothetical protein
MEGTISRYEDLLNDFAIGAVMMASAFTDNDLEYIEDYGWNRSNTRTDIIRMILKEIDPRLHEKSFYGEEKK